MTTLLLSCLIALAAPPIAPQSAPGSTVALTQMGPTEVGKPAPWFAGWTLDDAVLNRTRLLAAKPPPSAHALVFFATWCRPCLTGLKAIAAAQPQLEAAGVRVVLVDFREDAETVRPFLKEHGLQGLLVIVDKFGAVAKAFGATDGKTARLPRTVILDAAGVVRGIFAAEGDDYIQRLTAAVPGK